RADRKVGPIGIRGPARRRSPARATTPHSGTVSRRPSPALLRISAGVLDDADDDAGASGVRDGNDRLHRAGDSVRGAGPHFGIRLGVRGLPEARADAAARESRYAADTTAISA